MPVPYTFGSATSSIPLSQLDSNFATPVTIGTTTVALGNTITTITGLTTLNTLTVGLGGSAVSTNTAVGVNALAANTSGTGNASFGINALPANTTGSGNSAFNQSSLLSNTTGGSNTAYGNASLPFNTTGSSNTAIGQNSLYSNTTASNGTAVGYQAGYANTTGTSNTFYGYQAGSTLTTGAYGLYVGYIPTASGTGAVYEMVICNGTATGKGNSTGFINPNGGGMYQGNNTISWTVASDRRLKKNIVDNTEGLNIISQIRVRNFEYRLPEEITELDAINAVQKQGVQLGVIAQELLEVCGDCVKTESTGVMSVNSDNITWHMINAIKDLKALVDAQAARIATLEAR
jgi:hypothetical protein